MNDDPVRWLYGLERFGIKLGLDTMARILEQLGRPDRAAPSILIGGTNGKGSVAAFLDAILAAAGRRSGLYTSPHLVRLNERIRIGGDDIDDDALAAHAGRVRNLLEAAVADGRLPALPSFFEAITTIALLAFRDARVDVEVLEVGLGGRLDATNAVEALVSVVVSIDLDHTERLGPTIERIAFEKAGIAKAGRALVSGVHQAEAVAVLRAECERRGGMLVPALERTRVTAQDGARFTIETRAARYTDLRAGLAGRHQIDNARIAIVAAEELAQAIGFSLSADAVRAGLAHVRWPGRVQWIEGTPPVLLDGAHNPAGARALAAWLRERRGAPPVLLFGAMQGKDVEGILSPLAGLVERAILTRPRVARAAEPEDLRVAAGILGVPCQVVEDSSAAFASARDHAENTYVLVAGSLYLVGEILAEIEGTTPHPISM